MTIRPVQHTLCFSFDVVARQAGLWLVRHNTTTDNGIENARHVKRRHPSLSQQHVDMTKQTKASLNKRLDKY